MKGRQSNEHLSKRTHTFVKETAGSYIQVYSLQKAHCTPLDIQNYLN